MNLIEYADREMLAMNVANVLASELKKTLLAHETASVAVPGGSTPGPIFDMLGDLHLDWSRVQVLLTDERWVGEDDEMSNAALVRDRLLQGQAAAARFLPLHQPGQSPQEGAASASAALESALPLSLVMLGMGDDMHTASLFPGATGLEAAMAPDAPPVCAIEVPGQNLARVTLAAHVLEGAMSKHLVIYGPAKRAALEQAMELPPLEAPVAAVLEGASVHWAA